MAIAFFLPQIVAGARCDPTDSDQETRFFEKTGFLRWCYRQLTINKKRQTLLSYKKPIHPLSKP